MKGNILKWEFWSDLGVIYTVRLLNNDVVIIGTGMREVSVPLEEAISYFEVVGVQRHGV